MSKSKYFFGQPIFSQLIGLIKKDRIEALASEFKSDHYCKKFNTFQHLITMSYGILSGCNSLREMCTGIVSYGDKIAHCKFSYAPKRSTISDANSNRSYKVFEACYYDLLKRYSSDLSDSRTGIISDKKIFAIDSTTFSLFQPIFECVGRKATSGQSKGGIKSHQKLDLQMGIPVKVYNNHAREHDSVFIQKEDFLKENEIGVFDKAYNKYSAFAKWNTQNIFFVTRLKDNAKEELVEEFELSEATPNEVLRDAKIKLKYKEDNEIKELELRLVSYFDNTKNRCFYFLSNLFDLEPQQIADLYKMRWKVELLFKKVKQNFPLQYFYGESQNAIQIQLWCTLIVLLLVTVMQKALKTKWAFSNLISLMQKHLFTYIKFTVFFDHMDKIIADIKFYNNKDEYVQPELEGLTS
jgi:hypothetical protein